VREIYIYIYDISRLRVNVREVATSQFVLVCKKSGLHSVMSVICGKGGNFLALSFMGNNAILLCQVHG